MATDGWESGYEPRALNSASVYSGPKSYSPWFNRAAGHYQNNDSSKIEKNMTPGGHYGCSTATIGNLTEYSSSHKYPLLSNHPIFAGDTGETTYGTKIWKWDSNDKYYQPYVDKDNRHGIEGLDVLPNCVGYAIGRFNEIAAYYGNWAPNTFVQKYLQPVNAEDFETYKGSCKSGDTPQPGAVIVWRKGSKGNSTDGPGHVAIVERVIDSETIITSESGWSTSFLNGNNSIFKTTRKKGKDGDWIEGCIWMEENNKNILKTHYKFVAFIYNPCVASTTVASSGTLTDTQSQTIKQYTTKEVETQVTSTKARTVNYSGTLNRTKATSLLTYPSMVESPFVILTVGNYKFGNFKQTQSGSKLTVQYPNFIQGIEVSKVNGQVNQYTINLVYQISPGNDPNLLDKIFSSIGYGTSNYGKIKISYGDWQSPTLIYREEEALITSITTNVDFQNAKISYTLKATSTAVGLYATAKDFTPKKAKPSSEILRMLKDNYYGLWDVFPAMKNASQAKLKGWIATNDLPVQLEAKPKTDPLTYINYLVSCMIADTNSADAVILDSSYYMTIVDDIYGDNGGCYFTVKQVTSSTKTIASADTYEVDVGYPSDTMLMKFSVTTDNSWSMLYNYSSNIDTQDYVYSINDNGEMITSYSPSFSTSSALYKTSAPQKTWWTKMTQFPISASLEIKGLVRPAMLMSYIRVNAMFYGQRHIASGLYFVTKQVDKINGQGYRTTLTLQRFAGDEDYVKTSTETVKQTVLVENTSGSGATR